MVKSFYNYSKLLGYNGTYNILIGNRGKGKTYGAKKKVIKDGILKNDQFIFMRRYKEELATAKATFMDDIISQFEGYDFRINGKTLQWSHAVDRGFKEREWFTIGIFVALSQSQNYKGSSFPNVKTIIFDEFIIEKGSTHYMPDEVARFNGFYSTVDRWKDKTRVFFLANSVSIMNPYFIEWNILPKENDEFIIRKAGFLVCHIANNEDFNEEVKTTKFGRFISDTEFANYAIENKFADNGDSMLGSKDSKARYQYTLECNNGKFAVWYNFKDDYYWIQSKLPKDEILYTIIANKMDNNKILLSFSDKPLANLRTSFRKGNISFDDQVSREAFMEIFKR